MVPLSEGTEGKFMHTPVDLPALVLMQTVNCRLEGLGEYGVALINFSTRLAVFIFQITFKSEVCRKNHSLGAVKSHWPLLPASGSHLLKEPEFAIWES
jgi:hypothetical protein